MSAISAKLVKELRDSTGAGMMDCKAALADADGDKDKAAELLRDRGGAKAQKPEGRDRREGVIGISFEGASGALVELSCETDFVARTDGFIELAGKLAGVVAAGAGMDSVEALTGAQLDGKSVPDVIQETIAKTGENMVVQRVARIEVGGTGLVGGYVHAGGKLGVVVALGTEAKGDSVVALAKDIAMHVAAVDPSPVAVARENVDKQIVDKEREFYRKQAEQSGKPEKVIDKIVEGQVNKFYSQICLLEQDFVKDPDRKIEKVLVDASKDLGSEIKVLAYTRFKLGEADES